jgi:hypothetical protein
VLIPRSTSARRPWRASNSASTRASPCCTRRSTTVNAWTPGWRPATARPTSSSAPARRCSRR